MKGRTAMRGLFLAVLTALGLSVFVGLHEARAGDPAIAKPSDLDLETILADSATPTEQTVTAIVGGYLSPYGAFDLTARNLNAMLILQDTAPFGKAIFYHLPITLVTTNYTDPSSKITGDVYSANVPGKGTRYYLLGVGKRKHWVVIYNAEGKLELYTEAQVGFKKL
jgi:hypothetical protein